MNKKIVIIVLIAFVIILMCLLFTKKKSDKALSNELEANIEESRDSEIKLNEDTGEYIVYDKATGEEIARSSDEMSLHIYEVDPDYDPKTPITKDIIEEW